MGIQETVSMVIWPGFVRWALVVAVLAGAVGCLRPGPPRYCCGATCDDYIGRQMAIHPKRRPPIQRCPLEVSVGPSVGALVTQPAGHVGVDLTLSKGHVLAWWASLGSRLDIPAGARDLRGYSYVEGGMRLAFLVFGAGGGIRYGGGSAQAGPQLFLGFAWPITKNNRWYIEPYYRPAFLFDLADRRLGVTHELGVLFKFATGRAYYAGCGG